MANGMAFKPSSNPKKHKTQTLPSNIHHVCRRLTYCKHSPPHSSSLSEFMFEYWIHPYTHTKYLYVFCFLLQIIRENNRLQKANTKQLKKQRRSRVSLSQRVCSKPSHKATHLEASPRGEIGRIPRAVFGRVVKAGMCRCQLLNTTLVSDQSLRGVVNAEPRRKGVEIG